MSRSNALRVRRHPLWGFPDSGTFGFNVWQFSCGLCDESEEFAHWSVAIGFAQRHGQKHDERACPTCGNRPYIREDWAA